MIREFIAALRTAGLEEITGEEIADILWLANQRELGISARPQTANVPPIESPRTEEPPPENWEQPEQPPKDRPSTSGQGHSDVHLPEGDGETTDDVQTGATGGTSFPAPAAPALPNRLAVGRSLRGLSRRVSSPVATIFDEEATIRRIAEEGNWIPLHRPAPERWLDLALVMDESANMVIWRQTVDEMHALLERQGAFRFVTRWGLRADNTSRSTNGDAAPFYTGSRFTTGQLPPSRRPEELIHPQNRRLILVISDCVAAGWHDGRVEGLISTWAQTGMVSLFQVLPEDLWGRTGLGAGIPMEARALYPGTPNSKLARRYRWRFDGAAPPSGLLLPVTTLEPERLSLWARSLVARDSVWSPAILLPTDGERPSILDDTASSTPTTGVGWVERFMHEASPQARRLAGYLSVAPLSLPVMRLIQEAMMGDVQQVHLAEIFLSDLLVRRPGQDDAMHPDEVRYDFRPGVREVLLTSLLEDEIEEVLERSSRFVDRHIGKPIRFSALLADPRQVDSVRIDEESLPFASVSAEVLQLLGGMYRELAARLSTSLHKVKWVGQTTEHIQSEQIPFELQRWQDSVHTHMQTSEALTQGTAQDLHYWKDAVHKRMRSLAGIFSEMTSGVLYGALSASTILPLVAAVGQGDFGVISVLFGVAGGVGGNLIANQIQHWQDKDETELTQELAALAASDQDWRDALDALLLEFEVPRVVQAVLPEADWDRFQRLLRQELSQLGNLEKYEDYFVNTHGGVYVQGTVNAQGDLINRDKISHFYTIYQSVPGKPQMGEEEFTQALNRYLVWVVNHSGQLNLRGIERRDRQVLSLTIEDVYISLQVVIQPESSITLRQNRLASVAGEMPSRVSASQAIDMTQLLTLGSRLAIIGGPGSGKTTFLHIIAASLARALASGDAQEVARTLGLRGDLPLPIFVSLSDYNRYRRAADSRDPRQGTLTAFLTHSLIRQEAALGLPDDFFPRLLRQGQSCILLLDGLDEVADDRERVLVRQAVENLAPNGGIRHLLVTSRSRAYREGAVLAEDFRVVELLPMGLAQAQALADRWCRATYDATQAESESSRLRGAIAALEHMREQRGQPPLIDSPLLVTIVAIVHYNQRRLPDERAELYDRCVEVLLAESHKPVGEATFALQDWGGRWQDKRALLAHLAFRMMAAGEEGGRTVDEAQLRALLRPQVAKRTPPAEVEQRLDLFIQAMRERGSLLDERGGNYSFINLSFQEFLAAVYLVDVLRADAEVVDTLFDKGRIVDSWWRETVLLTVGYLGLRSTDAPLALIQALARRAQGIDFAMVATELIAVAFLAQNRSDLVTRDLLVAGLVGPLTDPTDKTSPVTRAAAGRRLSQLGDPRPGVGVVEVRPGVFLPDIDWVEIPGADADGRREFIYQNDELRTEPTFWIARYPVTYHQFQVFVDAADGMQNHHWWEGLIRRDNDNLGKQSFQFGNHPRENVTWYQAVAFCRWLTKNADSSLLPLGASKGGWRISLPTEWQWEKAARSHDGRRYPWGSDYISGYANVDETEKGMGPHNLGQTCAVGLYPQGASPYGLLDMSGNAWEWCLNEYRNPKRVQESGDATRVVRGGSWYSDIQSASTLTRNWRGPNFMFDYLGFRCVAIPISK